MKLSIVIPVHNAEQYLNDCIDSIYSQDVTDFEIIFVVNGSNDESENICLMARECHSNIRDLSDIRSRHVLLRCSYPSCKSGTLL